MSQLASTATSTTTPSVTHSKPPHPDHLKRLFTNPDDTELKEYISTHAKDHGFQLSLFHLYRSQSDLTLRLKAAHVQQETIHLLIEQVHAGDTVAQSELHTLRSTLQTFLTQTTPFQPIELKHHLEQILHLVLEVDKTTKQDH